MTTTTTAPATSTAVDFYSAARPLAEQLLAMARAWRERAPADPEAIRAHATMFKLVVHCDLGLGRAEGRMR